MSIATTAEQAEIQKSIARWAASVEPVAIVRRMEEGERDAWREVWEAVAGFGAFGVAMPEAAGGADGEIVDLAVMLEQLSAAMVPGPILSTALAGVLVGRAGGAVAAELGEDIAEGALQVGVVVDADSSAAVTATADGDTLVLEGAAGLALGGHTGGAVLLPVTLDAGTAWVLVDGDAEGLEIAPRNSFDLATLVADVVLDGVRVPASRILDGITSEHVLDLALTLGAAELSGVGNWTLTTAVDYAKIREQFGRTIGSFQSIKHLCADMLCRTEQNRALAWDAAVAAEDFTSADSELPVAAAVAGSIVLDNAVRNGQDCIQILGGIGFTFEHDAHFHLRRAGALRQYLGGASRWRRHLATATLEGRRRHLAIDLSADPAVAAELEGKREDVRALVREVAAAEGDARKAALADSGLFAPHLRAPWGRGAGAAEQLMIDEELAAAGVTRHDITIGGWAVPTILEHGTDLHIELAAPTLRGEIRWCQLFSEPGAGSDLAALSAFAEKVDGGWRVNGQKVWTSLAREADWAMLLARTDKDAPKHKGLSYFLVNMKWDGIRCAPLREITGDALFNEVFLEDLFIPDEYLVGAVNDGWKLARTTLANERVAMGAGSSLGDAVEDILGLVRASGGENDAVVLDGLGRQIADAVAGSVLELRTALRSLSGRGPGSESAVRKIVGVRHRQAAAEYALGLDGVAGATATEEGRKFLMVRCLSIAGGTEQVLLNVAGERILGLPRD